MSSALRLAREAYFSLNRECEMSKLGGECFKKYKWKLKHSLQNGYRYLVPTLGFVSYRTWLWVAG